MVKHVFILLMSCFLLPARAEDAFQFRTEFSKNDVYVGEEIRCDFVLYTNQTTIEVEVAKFPEFRGFWKENLVLRQGKILVPYSRFASSPWHRIVLGSYRIAAMVDEKDPGIRPMKLVIKSPVSEEADITVLSEVPTPLRVKKLPPLSNPDESFEGAVGQFTLSLDTPEVAFEQKEPAVLRFSLRGQGNFQEITGPLVDLPTGVKVLSKRVYTQGSAPYQIQNHEWTLSVDKDTDVELPPLRLTYFDPLEGRYETLQSEPGFLRFQATLSAPAPVLETVLSLEPVSQWQAHAPLSGSLVFWAAQAALLLGLALAIGRDVLRRRREAYLASAAYRISQMREETERAYAEGDLALFLKLGSELVVHHLRQKAPAHAPGTTREALLKLAAPTTASATLDQARRFFAAYESLAFSPSGQLPHEATTLYQDLQNILAA